MARVIDSGAARADDPADQHADPAGAAPTEAAAARRPRRKATLTPATNAVVSTAVGKFFDPEQFLGLRQVPRSRGPVRRRRSGRRPR